jgi:hypothetical protein
MTAVGKILVFFNFLFGIAVAALIVIVFTTRANWKKEYETARSRLLIAEAKYKERTAENESLKASQADETKSKDLAIKTLTETLAERDKQLAERTTERETESTKFQKETTSQTALQQEVGALKTERELLNKDVQILKRQVADEIIQTNLQRNLAVNNKIDADTQRARGDRLLRRVEELEKDNLVLANQNKILGASGATGGAYSLLNPPALPAPKDVKGTIIAVSSNGIAVVSLGSDSGINIGNKLEVYRLDLNNPDKSNYLGELVISRVEPKQSVGQFNPKPFARADERLPRKNDTVSTGVSGPGR